MKELDIFLHLGGGNGGDEEGANDIDTVWAGGGRDRQLIFVKLDALSILFVTLSVHSYYGTPYCTTCVSLNCMNDGSEDPNISTFIDDVDALKLRYVLAQMFLNS